MSKTKINIYNRQKEFVISSDIKKLVKKACLAALDFEKFEGPALIDVTFVNDEHIKKINRQFRNIDKSTDVLSFPLGEDGRYDTDPETGLLQLGDVVISVEHALMQSKLYGHSIEREFAFLTVHSVLHLLGYDHVNNKKEEKIMNGKQETILENMGLAVNKE